MPRIAVVSVGALVALLALAQLVVPPLAERAVEDRLERDGGAADVELKTFPAVRLLFGDGGSLKVRGRGLRVEPGGPQDALGRIDGFDEVDVSLHDVEAPPVELQTFELRRRAGERDYRVVLAGTTTPRDLARYLGSRAGGPLGRALGDLAAGSLPGGGGGELPVQLAGTIRSRGGEPDVRSARGSVAGVPAGPLARLVVGAVVRRL
jgi:hypothetical protein